MFKQFADKLNIRLVLCPKNLVFNFLEDVFTGIKFKVRPADADLKGKTMIYNPLLPFSLLPMSKSINIDTMNITSSDVEID